MKTDIKNLRTAYFFLVLMFTIILLMGSASAQLMYKQNDIISVRIPCINNGSYCSPSATCNLTVSYPNSSILINNQPMTNSFSFFNYTINTTDAIGEYFSSMSCIDGTISGTSTFIITITPSGFEVSTGQSIIYVIAIAFSVVILFLLLYASMAIPFHNFIGEDGKIISVNNFKFLKIGAIAGVYLVLMFLFQTLNSFTTNFMYSGSSSKIFEWLYSIMLAMMFPVAIVGIVLGFAVFINDIYVKKKLERRYYR